MAPPKIQDDDEEDFDDLDDILDEFNPSSSTSPNTTSKPTKPVPSTSTSASSNAALQDDFPDPDDPSLDDLDSPLSDEEAAQFAQQFQKSMASLLSSSSTGQSGSKLAGPADGAGPDFGLSDEEMGEFSKMMQDLLKGGAGEGVGEGDIDPSALLAALSGLDPTSGAGSGLGAGSSKSKGGVKKKAAPTTTTEGPPQDFQSTIASTLSKMKDSSDSATASASQAANAEVDPLASMMAQMAGLGDLGGDPEGLQGMLDEMMEQLMSRELLYDPLKELAEKYPGYLKENEGTLKKEDKERYEKQFVVVKQIVGKFEEPGAEKDDSEVDKLTAKEKEDRKRRREEVAELVKQMNDCGAPPSEIMGEMPEGMELGPDGVPKLPGDCIIS